MGSLTSHIAILAAGFSVAAALVFLGLAGRYEFVQAGGDGSPAIRFDRLTGRLEVCISKAHQEGDIVVTTECAQKLNPYK